MKSFKLTYILSIALLFFVSCRMTKNVPNGGFLLKKNKIVQKDRELSKSELYSILKQQPNYKVLGVKWKLIAYNSVDSIKVYKKRTRKNIALREKNERRIKKAEEINDKRISRAKRQNKDFYNKKTPHLKDTVNPKRFFREWLKYKIGEPPVLLDTVKYNRSIKQIKAYQRSKGYFYGDVYGEINYDTVKRKATLRFFVENGEQYIIDTVRLNIDNEMIAKKYQEFIEEYEDPFVDAPFDAEKLDDFRSQVSKYMKNHGVYGFTGKSITFEADTNRSEMLVDLEMTIGNRIIIDENMGDSLVEVPYKEYRLKKTVFYFSDTNEIENYSNLHDSPDELNAQGFLITYDSLYYREIKLRKSDELDSSRMITVRFNGRPYIKARVLEMENYSEPTSLYSDANIKKSYLELLRSNQFGYIKTKVVEEDDDGLTVRYYLVPAKKQSFIFTPKATNSNGFLGVSATASWTNKNLFGGAERMTLSLSGGFESSPPIFDETISGEKTKLAARSFNIFEIGPSIKFQLPGLFPFKIANVPKELRPQTEITVGFNYQKRIAFSQGAFQISNLWKFYQKQTMIFESGIPFVSIIKFVDITKSQAFDQRLKDLNDLFLLNAYSDQFIWQEWRFGFQYNTRKKEVRKRSFELFYDMNFDPAGNLLSLFSGAQDTVADGRKAIFGVPYAQFVRLDNVLILNQPTGRETSLNFRFQIGMGQPYGNSKLSMPYDYAFFAGGANDIRGWRARALGPGVYKSYLDSNSTATQMGDMKLALSSEFRFSITSSLKGAFFVDAGNVWTVNEDVNRPGGHFSKDWYKQIALAGGVGLRFDMSFLILRADIGIPLFNPSYPKGARFIFDSRQAYKNEAEAKFGSGYADIVPKAFVPVFHFGVGYPF